MSKIIKKHSRLLGLILCTILLGALLWVSCSEQLQSPGEAPSSQEELVLSPTNPRVLAAMKLQADLTPRVIAKAGIVGTATGMTEDGQPAVMVLVETAAQAKRAGIPTAIDGTPVKVLVTGVIKALKGPPGGGGGFDPTQKHRPAPNGVSIGHPDITAGTLGCLVSSGNNTYILSNNHVMANENQANVNDPIYQPGPFDGGTGADAIASLSDWVNIVFSTGANNVVDGAIAAVDPADVTGATHPDAGSYGSPRSQTASASINLRVMKYGRTTEHTKGRVQAINATVNIGYDSGVARFVNQIIIGGGGFSAGGDSGSLIVVEKGQDARKPVGLLFAGSSSITIANPIDDVLSAFNVTVVGD